MISIAGRSVGAGAPCLLIAELGTSHQGERARARELVDAAAAAGADCIKFQLVHADEILHPLSGIVDLPTGKVALYEQFRSLEKAVGFYEDLKSYTESRGVLFLCSPFGLRSARELKSIGVRALKIASPGLDHFPLLEEDAGYGLPLFSFLRRLHAGRHRARPCNNRQSQRHSAALCHRVSGPGN